MHKSYAHLNNDTDHDITKSELNFHTIQPLRPSEYHRQPATPPRKTSEAIIVAQPPAELLKTRLQFMARQMVFRFNKPVEMKVETRQLLMRSLLLLLAEYLIFLAFQLISYFTLEKFWKRSKYIPGVILGITYATLVVVIILLINKKHKTLLFVLKTLEFVTAFFLYGYLVAWDFGTMSLSYMIVLDILIIFGTVG